MGVFPDMRCKGSHRARIACFQFGKCLKIALRRGIFVLCIRKGFESTQSLCPTPQNKLPDRPSPNRRERCTDTYASAELLVGSFQAPGDVDGVAIGCVVEEAAATEIADDRRPGVDANARDTQRNALFMTACAERLGVLVKSQCAGTARAAWSGCSPGAPNSTCNASPTIFATVPSCAPLPAMPEAPPTASLPTRSVVSRGRTRSSPWSVEERDPRLPVLHRPRRQRRASSWGSSLAAAQRPGSFSKIDVGERRERRY
jgi:hypothetical protein